MNTKIDRKQLAIDLCYRSSCSVKMAAIISDKVGIISWGWNHLGTGFGCHAEEHAISRANRKRLKGATITVVGIRKKNFVYALPCQNKCMPLIIAAGISKIEFFDKEQWRTLEIK